MQAYHDGFILSNFKVSWYNLTRSEQSNGFLGVGTKVVPVPATWSPGRAAQGHCGALMSCGTEELLLSSLTDLCHTWDVQDSCGRLHTFPSFALLPQSEFFLLNEQFTYSLPHWWSIKDYFFSPCCCCLTCPRVSTMLTAPNLMLFSIFQPGWGHFSSITQPLCSLSLNTNSDWKPHSACSYPVSIANSNDLSKHSLFGTIICWRQGRWRSQGTCHDSWTFKKPKTKPEQQKVVLADTSYLWVLLGLRKRGDTGLHVHTPTIPPQGQT